jgi:hypothetical protein
MNNVSQYKDVCFLHEIHQVNNTRLGSVGCQRPDRDCQWREKAEPLTIYFSYRTSRATF